MLSNHNKCSNAPTLCRGVALPNPTSGDNQTVPVRIAMHWLSGCCDSLNQPLRLVTATSAAVTFDTKKRLIV